MKSLTSILVLGFMLILTGTASALARPHHCKARHPVYYLSSQGVRVHGKYGPAHFMRYHRIVVRGHPHRRVPPVIVYQPQPIRPVPRHFYKKPGNHYRPRPGVQLGIHIVF